jgi:hypothetical protein
MMIQPFELRRIGRKRPAAVCRQARQDFGKRHVDPDGHAVEIDRGAVFRVDECPTSGRDDRAAQGEQDSENLAFGRTEVRFAESREDFRDGQPFAGLDEFIDIFRPPVEGAREQA